MTTLRIEHGEDGKWRGALPDAARASFRKDRQSDAVATGENYLRKRGGGTLVIEQRDGKTRERAVKP